MKPARFFGVIAYPSLCLLFASAAQAQPGPVVSNVTAAQRADFSRLVDVHYNLSASVNCTVWIVVSDNGGTTWTVPAQTVSGAVGPNISPGTNKWVTWDAGGDIPARLATSACGSTPTTASTAAWSWFRRAAFPINTTTKYS